MTDRIYDAICRSIDSAERLGAILAEQIEASPLLPHEIPTDENMRRWAENHTCSITGRRGCTCDGCL